MSEYVCLSVKRKYVCQYRNCRYAHNINELLVKNCKFNEHCKYSYKCRYKHSNETMDNFYKRRGFLSLF